MRQLIIERLNAIKTETSGFSIEPFIGFMIGAYNIQDHPPFEGMPDEVLLIFYEEVLKVVVVMTN